MRSAKRGAFKLGDQDAQYREYHRSASADDRAEVAWTEPATLAMMVNPCNPTGRWIPLEAMKKRISDEVEDGSVVIVDESMIFWHPEWRSESLTSCADFTAKLLAERDIAVYVMISWTKIWACPGIRLGSLVAPSAALLADIKRHQVPWSLNSMAIAFTAEVVKDTPYMEKTWKETPVMRAEMIARVKAVFPDWVDHGEPWLSWVWIDAKDAALVAELKARCLAAGVPIRSGANGYNRPTFLRLGVRPAAKVDVLVATLEKVKSEMK